MFQRAFLRTLLVLALLIHQCQAQLEFLKPKGWVNDFAGVLDINMTKHMALICAEVDKKAHAQITVVTIKTTEGTPIGDYTRLLFNKWGIGNKEDNRGILILLSITDHMYFITVSGGFEPLFPNDRVAGIGIKMIPDLSQRRYGTAALHSLDEIAKIIADERGVSLTTLGAPTVK